jgi:hypothetical protein
MVQSALVVILRDGHGVVGTRSPHELQSSVASDGVQSGESTNVTAPGARPPQLGAARIARRSGLRARRPVDLLVEVVGWEAECLADAPAGIQQHLDLVVLGQLRPSGQV